MYYTSSISRPRAKTALCHGLSRGDFCHGLAADQPRTRHRPRLARGDSVLRHRLPAATAEFLVSRAQNAPREMVVWNVAQLCRLVLMAVVFLRPVVYAAILASLTMSSYLVRRCLLTRRSCLSILVSSVHFMAYMCVFCMMLVVHDAMAVVLLNALYWLPLRPDNVKQWTFDAFVLFFYCQSLHKSKRMSFSENI